MIDDLIRSQNDLRVVMALIKAAAEDTQKGRELRGTVCRDALDFKAFYVMADRIHAAHHVPKIMEDAAS